MKLLPNGPPGRANCKARQYQEEIVRLRVAGYTFESIREALANVGVQVSRCTVQREAAMYLERQAAHPAPLATPPPPSVAAAERTSPSHGTTSLANDTRTGKEIAEQFFQGRIHNPLIRAKNRP